MSGQDLRERGMDLLIALEGTPYVWGGDLRGPPEKRGLDCSGLYVLILCKLGLVDEGFDAGAAWLFDHLEPVQAPDLCDAAFYGTPTKVTHLMVVSGPATAHAGLRVWPVTGASGGTSSTLTVQDARRVGAKVKTYGSHLYRRDFRGFRRLPLQGLTLQGLKPALEVG